MTGSLREAPDKKNADSNGVWPYFASTYNIASIYDVARTYDVASTYDVTSTYNVASTSSNTMLHFKKKNPKRIEKDRKK